MAEYADDVINSSMSYDDDDYNHDADNGISDELYAENKYTPYANLNAGYRSNTPKLHTYEICIVNNATNQRPWCETIKASSKLNARNQFNKEYPLIRAKYKSEGGYSLGIKKL